MQFELEDLLGGRGKNIPRFLGSAPSLAALASPLHPQFHTGFSLPGRACKQSRLPK